MSESRARGHLGGKSHGKSGHKGKVHSVHVRRAAGGGFIVRNEREADPENPGQPGNEEYAVADQNQLAQHLDDHLGDQPAASGAAPVAPAQAAPAVA